MDEYIDILDEKTGEKTGKSILKKEVLQEDEVSEIKWCSKEELNKFIEDNNIIPHVREYEILNEVLN